VHHASGTRLALPKKAEISVGRPDKHAGSTPDIDLSPFDTERTLSRQHARFVVKGEDVFVREEASARNGTFVNGRRVQADTEVPVTDGDRVRFGAVDTVFRFL
jgi:pSer/pThr/pTyr-binding forkhead associated (FHA) protein